MLPYLIIYSPNEIRGQIISKTLMLNGIEAFLFHDHHETEAAINANSAPVVILDAKHNLSNVLGLWEKCAYKLPETTFIILSESSNFHILDKLNPGNMLYASDPLDPAYILMLVKNKLSERIADNTPPLPEPAKSIRSQDTSQSHESKHLGIRRNLGSAAIFRRLNIFWRYLPIFITLIIGLAGGYLYWCIASLPDIDILKMYSPYNSSEIYSYDNQLLSKFYIERRTLIPFEKIPKHLIDAFIAIEDTRYFKHSGIDPVRILKAFYTNIIKGAYLEGGSTITQQLSKMIFLTPEKKITRKIQEIVLSLRIEKKYTKDQILEMYFNQAYFGERAYGLEAASQTYFGKSVDNITLSEAALIAALTKAPSIYSPFKNPKKCLNRRNYVLKRMLITGSITQPEYERVINEPLPKTFYGRKFEAPYFVEFCKLYLEQKYGRRLYTSGLRIYTTLDYDTQQIAEKAVRKGIDKLIKRGVGQKVQAALLAMDLRTGRILAMVGGVNFWNSQFNRTTQAKRQPGSAFKPFVYLTALNQGFNPDDTIEDIIITHVTNNEKKSWTPKNHKDRYHGTVTLQNAMAHSLNCATVNLSKIVGIDNIIQSTKALGITSTIHPLYSSVLGASELTLIEIVFAYAALATGNRIQPIYIDRIIDREQSALFEPSGQREKVINSVTQTNIKKMLRAVILEGTGRKARTLNRIVYGKTGTTNDNADALFIGFDDNIAAGVWVGMDDHTPIGSNETGASAALPIWIEFMQKAAG